MKVKIDIDELYPYYMVSTRGKEITIADNQLKKWNKILKQFKQMQEEMEKMVENVESS